MTSSPGAAPRNIENIIPILSVRDLGASIRFYENVLSFAVDWSVDDFAGLSRDGWRLYLSEGGDSGAAVWLWIGVEDVDRMYEECRARGAEITTEMTSNAWAREFQVTDPDGHVLRFGGAPEADQT